MQLENDRRFIQVRVLQMMKSNEMPSLSQATNRAPTGRDESVGQRIATAWALRRSLALLIGLGLTAAAGSTAFAAPPSAVPSPTANRVWGGCNLKASATLSEIAGSTGVPVSTVNFIVVYSLYPNDGQPVATSTAYTGPIVCTTTAGLGTSIAATTENTVLSNIDILSAEQIQVVGYDLAPFGSITSEQKQICRNTAGQGGCFDVKPPALATDQCRLSTQAETDIKKAIAFGNTGIVDDLVRFAFIMVHSVQAVTGREPGREPSRICAAPGYTATVAPGSALIPPQSPLVPENPPIFADVKDTEQGLAIEYRTSGGTLEKRFCHTVTDKTDCFRLFQ
jgi:hypothetical protein